MKRKVSTVAVGAKTIVTAYNAGKGMEMFEKTLSQLEERLVHPRIDAKVKVSHMRKNSLEKVQKSFHSW